LIEIGPKLGSLGQTFSMPKVWSLPGKKEYCGEKEFFTYKDYVGKSTQI